MVSKHRPTVLIGLQCAESLTISYASWSNNIWKTTLENTWPYRFRKCDVMNSYLHPCSEQQSTWPLQLGFGIGTGSSVHLLLVQLLLIAAYIKTVYTHTVCVCAEQWQFILFDIIVMKCKLIMHFLQSRNIIQDCERDSDNEMVNSLVNSCSCAGNLCTVHIFKKLKTFLQKLLN